MLLLEYDGTTGYCRWGMLLTDSREWPASICCLGGALCCSNQKKFVLGNTNDMLPFAPGSRALIRDEEWLIRRVDPTTDGGWLLSCDGVSELVRGQSALFLTELEGHIEVLDPAKTQLVSAHGAVQPMSYYWMAVSSCSRQFAFVRQARRDLQHVVCASTRGHASVRIEKYRGEQPCRRYAPVRMCVLRDNAVIW